jgi:hypothetical protein
MKTELRLTIKKTLSVYLHSGVAANIALLRFCLEEGKGFLKVEGKHLSGGNFPPLSHLLALGDTALSTLNNNNSNIYSSQRGKEGAILPTFPLLQSWQYSRKEFLAKSINHEAFFRPCFGHAGRDSSLISGSKCRALSLAKRN